jgi:retron-type reverse transcriptase
MNRILESWRQHYLRSGLDQELAEAYLAHVATLTQRGLPPILDFQHLALLLGRKSVYLASVIGCSEAHYREFSIKKRSGGKRDIRAPYPALLECQQWINSQILSKANLHFTTHGFTTGRSILTNAIPHLNASKVLKMDIKDFFHSISIKRVIALFQSIGYSHRIAVYLARISCLQDRLPQGAATSPGLSNAICYQLDKRLHGIANYHGLNYSRYADDLTFSGSDIERTFPSFIATICLTEGFEINATKTRLCSGNGKKIVTGISVSSTVPKIPRTYKRKLRQQVHCVRKYGVFSHVKKKKDRTPFLIQSLIGKLQFWLLVEPEDPFPTQAISDLRAMLA